MLSITNRLPLEVSSTQKLVLIDMKDDSISSRVIAHDGTRSISVLLSDSRDGFGAPTSYAIGACSFGITRTDMNEDGLSNIVGVSRFKVNAVTTLLNNG